MTQAGQRRLGVRAARLAGLGCLVLLLGTGCALHREAAPGPVRANPLVIPVRDYDFLWEQLVDVINDDFRIEREARVRVIEQQITEGYLETAPISAATWLEPWRSDSVTHDERWVATLQTIRRRVIVRVIPCQGGAQVEILAFKELEDLPRPNLSTTGEATFRSDFGRQPFREPVGEAPLTIGWIPLGRDLALEQLLLGRLARRFGT